MREVPFWIAARLWTFAALLRILKHVVPLGTLVRLMRVDGRGRHRSRAFERSVEAYLNAEGPFPRRPPSNCLERSLGVYRLLSAANAAPTLAIGFRRSAGTALDGHVWVVVDGHPFGESADQLAGYTLLTTFDAAGRQSTSGGPSSIPTGITLS